MSAGARLALCTLLAAAAAGAGELQVSFERVVGTGDTLPGRSETFSTFHTPALDGERVGFIGQAAAQGPSGIYVASPGGMVTIADTETQIPGAPPGQTFVGFSNPSLSGELVAFTGARDVSGFRFEGVVLHDGDELAVVARNGDPAPGSPPRTYFFFFTVSLDQGALAFTTGTSRGWQIDSTAGGLHLVADESTLIPGTGETFPNFGFNPTFDAGFVGFTGGDGFPVQRGGVYRGDGGDGGPTLVADVDTAIPGGLGTFTDFLDGPTIRGARVAFRARGAGNQLGNYLHEGGGILRVADRTTPIPEGTGTFLDLDANDYEGPALDECGNVAFEGIGGGGQKGIYLHLAGGEAALHKVVDLDDPLDGRDLTAVAIGRESLDAGRLVLVVGFADGTGGIYRATIAGPDGEPICRTALFLDGFESGDTSAWSATEP